MIDSRNGYFRLLEQTLTSYNSTAYFDDSATAVIGNFTSLQLAYDYMVVEYPNLRNLTNLNDFLLNPPTITN